MPRIYLWDHALGIPYFVRYDRTGDNWRRTWFGYGRVENRNIHPSAAPELSNDNMHRMLTHNRYDRLLRPHCVQDCLTHEFRQVPSECWCPMNHMPRIRLLSPHGTVRLLRRMPYGSRWIIETRVPVAAIYVTTSVLEGLTEAQVHDMIEKQGWLTVIPGGRTPRVDESVRSFALTRL